MLERIEEIKDEYPELDFEYIDNELYIHIDMNDEDFFTNICKNILVKNLKTDDILDALEDRHFSSRQSEILFELSEYDLNNFDNDELIEHLKDEGEYNDIKDMTPKDIVEELYGTKYEYIYYFPDAIQYYFPLFLYFLHNKYL
jgi:hypothetical protein